MEFVADLHLHSKYSRAVSQNMILPTMASFAREKGLNLLSVSDFTHPLWLREAKSQLMEDYDGIYKLKTDLNKQPVYFLFSTEIACIYKQGEKLRRIHNLVFAPNLETVEKINAELTKRGCNVRSDGRPIIGMASKNLLELILGINEKCMLIPCHVWTPHFGVYGSKSGFNSLEECFEDFSKYIYGVETGISSDPEMNWRISELKNRSIVSFSDAHSPANMAREATVFLPKNGITNDQSPMTNLSYDDIRLAIKRDPEGKLKIGYTIEFYPEEGKYHFSGHRNCGVSLSPKEVATKGTLCPVCHREFTEGVAIRIEQLAGNKSAQGYKEIESPHGVKWYTDSTKHHPPYVKLVRLIQIVAQALDSTVTSQKTKVIYENICKSLGSELTILLKIPLSEIAKIGGEKVAQGVGKVRRGDISVDAGFDGEYGKVNVFTKSTQDSKAGENNISSQLGIDF